MTRDKNFFFLVFSSYTFKVQVADSALGCKGIEHF